jgi:MarR family transcriptional regulator, organic hydroperoxide resistance regulator
MLNFSARPLSAEQISSSRRKIVSVRNRAEKPDQAPLNPEEFLPAYFHRITNLLSTRLLERLRIHGVTVPRWRVLINLIVRDGRTIGDLAESTIISQPVLSRIVDQMERDSLVTRRTAERDSRVVEVYLTPRGRALYTKIAPVAARHAQLTVKSLTPAQRKELLAMLRIIIRDLSEAPSIEAEEKAFAQRTPRRRPSRRDSSPLTLRQKA